MNTKNNLADRIELTFRRLWLLREPFKELYFGITKGTFPWDVIALWTVVSAFILFFKIDNWLFAHTRFSGLYPYHPILYRIHAFLFSTLGIWVWAWREVFKKRARLKLLTDAFKNAGLQSTTGRVPNLIGDYPIDSMTRKLRLTNAGFPLKSFQDQARFIESELGIFIDEIKERREKRAVDIIYSHFPMATEVPYLATEASGAFEFLVGQTRANTITSSFLKSPHLMIAGQTGGGKSTFLRQLIIHLYQSDRNTRFLLIDLKGGLEFSLFEDRPSFAVVPNVSAAIGELDRVNKLLDERMAFLKTHKCKDIPEFFRKKNELKVEKPLSLARQMIVVDEAAEMFLAGHHAKSNDILKARFILSRIARQGRAVGIHLIVATQRPDSKSLDPQVKANLTSVVCFQMMNDASSIAVLGNGRASDLPAVPGRAIWKNGIQMIEVQTPYLSVEEAEKILGPAPDKKVVEAAKPALTIIPKIAPEAASAENDLEGVEVD